MDALSERCFASMSAVRLNAERPFEYRVFKHFEFQAPKHYQSLNMRHEIETSYTREKRLRFLFDFPAQLQVKVVKIRYKCTERPRT